MHTNNKWNKAQELELMNWKRKSNKLYSTQFLHKRADVICGMLKLFIQINKQTRIIEIGGAGMPIIDYMQSSIKYGLDPLAHHYKYLFESIYNNKVYYLSSKAEKIPFKNETVDIVILVNVIDHTLNPEAVVLEIHRVMKPGGILFLSVDTYSKLINIMREVRIILGIKRPNDILHPHHFTLKEIFRLLNSQFEPLSVCNSVLDPISMGNKKGYPLKGGFLTRIRNDNRFYFIGRKY